MLGDVKVVDWSPEPLDADLVERERLITEALDECDRGRFHLRVRMAVPTSRSLQARRRPAR